MPMSPPRARAFALLAIVAVSSFAAPARAEPEADAKDLFSRGRALRLQGDCAHALPDFRTALSLFPAALGSARNIAECEETLGHWASARRAWRDLERAASASSDPKYETWSSDAHAAAARLAPLVARLTVVVVGKNGELTAGAASAARVLVNGEALATTLIGSPLDRDPGAYDVRVEGPAGASMADERVVLAAGDDRTVRLRLVVSAVPPGEPPPARAPEDVHRTRRALGWVTLGAGGIALVGAGVAAVVRSTALADLKRDCPGYASSPCEASVRSEATRGHSAATLVDVFGAVGVLSAGAGVALVLLSPSTPGVTLRPTVGRVDGVVAEWTLW